MPSGGLFWFDSLTAVSSALFVGLALATYLGSPKRDRDTPQLVGLAFIVAGTLIAYSAGSLALFALGWAITIVPYWAGFLPSGPRVALGAGTLALAAGAIVASLPGENSGSIAFGLLVLAALLRKGIFPFHSWVITGFERSPLLPLGLLLNGHLGGYLLIRFAIPQFPMVAQQALPFLSLLALLTALYMAVMALSRRSPARILALLSVSQASFILAGLESRNEQGVAGALIHWTVVAVATTGLYIVYRSVEARYAGAASGKDDLGLVGRTPRLAVFFAFCGLALVGLPGTLGFAAEDLLFHGSLESHPLLGITLPLATALNAITVYRLFSRLFLGRATNAVPPMPDALPRERFVLTMAALFLIVFGVAPGLIVSARTPTAARLAQLLGER